MLVLPRLIKLTDINGRWRHNIGERAFFLYSRQRQFQRAMREESPLKPFDLRSSGKPAGLGSNKFVRAAIVTLRN